MAVVQDYYSPEGCHIIVHDDCYRDLTPEENQSRKHNAEQIVLRAALVRKYGELVRNYEEFARYMESPEKHENQEI